MKSKSYNLLLQVITFVMVLALLAAVTLPQIALAQTFQPTFYQNVLTNGTVTLTTTQTTNLSLVTKPIYVRPGKGLVFMPLQAAASATSATNWYFFDVTADGTNYTTTTPLSAPVSFYRPVLGATNLALGYIIFTPLQLDNVRAVRLAWATNNTGVTTYITNVIASYGNQ